MRLGVTGSERLKIGNALACGKASILVLSLLFFGVLNVLHASEPGRSRQGARIGAMGMAGTAVAGDTWSLYHNPALLSRDGVLIGGEWSPAPFGLTELSRGAAAVTWGSGAWSLAGAMQTTGFALYRETEGAVAVSADVSGGLRIGLTFGLRDIAIPGYGSAQMFTVDCGTAVEIGDQAVLAATVSALNRPQLGATGDRAPIMMALGAAFQPDAQVVLVLDAIKDLRHPAQIRAGVEYRPFDLLRLRAGSLTEPGRFTAGIGLEHSGVRLDYALVTHSELGATHMMSVALGLPQYSPRSTSQ